MRSFRSSGDRQGKTVITPSASHGPGTATATRAARDALSGWVVTAVLAALAIAVASGAIVVTYRIGDSGSRAAWTGHFSAQQLGGRSTWAAPCFPDRSY